MRKHENEPIYHCEEKITEVAAAPKFVDLHEQAHDHPKNP